MMHESLGGRVGDGDATARAHVWEMCPVGGDDTQILPGAPETDYPERAKITAAAQGYVEATTTDEANGISTQLHADLRSIFRGPQQNEFEIRGCRQAIVAAVRCYMDIEVMKRTLPIMRDHSSLVPRGASDMSPSVYSNEELPRHIYPEPYHTFMCAGTSWLAAGADRLFSEMQEGTHAHSVLLPVLAAEFAQYRDSFGRDRFPHSYDDAIDGWMTGLRGNVEIFMNVLEARRFAFIKKFGTDHQDLGKLLVKAALRDVPMMSWPNTVGMHKLDTMLPRMHAWIPEEDRDKPPRVLVDPFRDSASAMEEIGDSPHSPQAVWSRLQGPQKREGFCHGNIDVTPVEQERQIYVDDFFEEAEARSGRIIPRGRSGEFNATIFGLTLGAYIAADTIYAG